MIVSKYGYRRNSQGNWTKKPIDQLHNSDHLVLIRCKECGCLYKTLWNNRKRRIEQGKGDMCHSCSKSGTRNSQHGKNRTALMHHAFKFKKQNSMQGKRHSAASKKKMSDVRTARIAAGDPNMLSNNRGRKSWYESAKNNDRFHADSALEYMRMMQLDADPLVVSWTKKHRIRVPYIFDGVERYSVPDFLVVLSDGTNLIEEVKGRITPLEMVKREATEIWCKKNNFQFRYLLQSELNENGEYRKFLRGRGK